MKNLLLRMKNNFITSDEELITSDEEQFYAAPQLTLSHNEPVKGTLQQLFKAPIFRGP